MAGSIFGNIFRISTWGESHGKGIGVVVDGCPAGLSIDEEYIQKFLDRRKPGQSQFTTQRSEADQVKIMSGVFEGKTTGTPIAMMIENTSQRSGDYGDIAYTYRPGHADYGFDAKYGFRDYRGGGRSSGRETAARVAAGAIAIKILEELGISITTYVSSVGNIEIDDAKFDREEISKNMLYMPDHDAYVKAEEYLLKMKQELDSVGAVVKCKVNGVKPGVGEPVFDKMDARLAQAIMSIGAVKSVEIGDGKEAARLNGSVNNDGFIMEDGRVAKKTNHSGGILGGITDGSEIIITAAFKPTPSIYQKQKTVNNKFEDVNIEIKGRHDPIVAPRAVVVVESMTAITILDEMLMNLSSRMDYIKMIYGN